MTLSFAVKGRLERRINRRCPRPECRRSFPSNRSVNQHLRSEDCREWYGTVGVTFNGDSSSESSDGLTARDEAEAELATNSRRELSYQSEFVGNESRDGRRNSHAEPCIADGCDEAHPRPSRTFDRGHNVLERIKLDDTHSEARNRNRYYPFATREDWETASWLSRNDLSVAAVNEYLHLHKVSRAICMTWPFC